MFSKFISVATLSLLWTSTSYASVCDYRPSQIIGSTGTAFVAGAAGSTATAGAVANAVGVYTLVHAGSGLTMVGGAWAGASAAGTAGIIAGTGGVIGTTVAIITAPAVIVGAGVAAATIGAYEGACFFTDTRITDYDEIDAIVSNVAVTAPESVFRYRPGAKGAQAGVIFVLDPDSVGSESRENQPRFDRYEIDQLYIVNGVLKHRDYGINTTIGNVAVISE